MAKREVKWSAAPFRYLSVILVLVTILPVTAGMRKQDLPAVRLAEARFQGLTRIVASTNMRLAGIDAGDVVITRPDGRVVPASEILEVEAGENTLTVVIDAGQFARITSQGTTIATRAFGSFQASEPVVVLRDGEPAVNGHITGSSRWTDEGWSTSKTDRSFYDPVTGQMGLYRFTDVTPDRDENGRPMDWNDGQVTTPVHRAKNMLVLFVEFPDRRAADAEAPYTTIRPYREFLQGAVHWYELSSYGQFRFKLETPQETDDLGWIMMSKNAADYPWSGQTHDMFAYIGEACQLAYDNWGIRADDYDMLLVMPARGESGLFNGPSNINRDPGDREQPNVNHVAFIDKEGNRHYIDTALTAGNDLFRWGYRWLIHESGHAFGFPDLYMYRSTVNGVRVGAFFYCGGWDMMGNIAGHSTEFLAWHKWKLRWIRDDQVDVVSRAHADPGRHWLTPVETPGGTKMVVVRTGLSTAYVAEFRTKLGVNALDARGKYSGVLIYRIDASQWEASETNPTAQVISRTYYDDPAVGGPKNLTGVWRPVNNTLTGYDSPGSLWQPGDVFSDPVTGVSIRVDAITNHNADDPNNSPYTADDVATLTVTKNKDAELFKKVVLSNARLTGLTRLTFDTNVEMQLRIPIPSGGAPNVYVREESRLRPKDLVITRADGTVVPAEKITGIIVNPESVEVTLAPDAFPDQAAAAGATVATRPYYYYQQADRAEIYLSRGGR